jgi:hypothetical protein
MVYYRQKERKGENKMTTIAIIGTTTLVLGGFAVMIVGAIVAIKF